MIYDCLIIDDEPELASGICEYFNLFEVKSHYVLNSDDALEFLKNNTVNLILLDINLGEGSGFTLCKTLRETLDIPILFISARTSNEDMLLALNIGGDDYIQKPYSLAVLLAKVKAVLKRYKTRESETFISDDIKIDFTTCDVFVNEQKIELKTMEYKLLAYLVKNKNRIVTKDEIFKNVWEDSITTDNTLNVHIRHLREKIENDPNEPRYIKTVWGTGYKFEFI